MGKSDVAPSSPLPHLHVEWFHGFYGFTVLLHKKIICHIECNFMQEHYQILDCSYPPSFLPSARDKSFARLPFLSQDILLTCVQRFRQNVPKGYQTKAGYVNLIQSDFTQQMNLLIRSSTSELECLLILSLAGHPAPRLSLICQIIHECYGTVVASHLLCSQARWNPPEVAEDEISLPIWLHTPHAQLRSRLAKLNTGIVKTCCDMYIAASAAPKSKTEKYNLIIW